MNMRNVILISALLISVFTTAHAQFDKYDLIEESPVDNLTKMSEDAGETGEDMERIYNSIFKILDPSIKETFELADYVREKEGTLSTEDEGHILEGVKKIYKTFSELAQDKEYWSRELEGSVAEVLDLVKEGENMRDKYAKETEKLMQRFDEKSREGIPEVRQRMMIMGIELSKERAKLFHSFHKQLDEYKDFNDNFRHDINEFMEVIHESAITTQMMVELMELRVQREVILDNLDGLLNLEEYINNINQSLQQLGEALLKLQNMADEYNNS